MVTITPDRTLGSIVDEHPTLARELEHRGLDYCCGGSRSLAEACAESGLDPDAVAAELTSVTVTEPPAPWTTMGLVQLVDHIEATHHAYLLDELPRLAALADTVVRVHGGRHPELASIRECFRELRADLEPHLLKEERILFPAIRHLATADSLPSFPFGPMRHPISVMLREHDQVAELLLRLRTLTSEYRVPSDGCASYEALFRGFSELESDTHLHVHKENNVLFPAVERLERRLAGPA